MITLPFIQSKEADNWQVRKPEVALLDSARWYIVILPKLCIFNANWVVLLVQFGIINPTKLLQFLNFSSKQAFIFMVLIIILTIFKVFGCDVVVGRVGRYYMGIFIRRQTFLKCAFGKKSAVPYSLIVELFVMLCTVYCISYYGPTRKKYLARPSQ